VADVLDTCEPRAPINARSAATLLPLRNPSADASSRDYATQQREVEESMLRVYTAQIGTFRGADALDITIKSAPREGRGVDALLSPPHPGPQDPANARRPVLRRALTLRTATMMKPTHVPGFLGTQSALAFILGRLSAWAIGLGDGAPVIVLGIRLDAGLLITAGVATTLLLLRIALRGWTRHVRAQASEAVGSSGVCRQRWRLPRSRRGRVDGRQFPLAWV
jgi:hypothetical protein